MKAGIYTIFDRVAGANALMVIPNEEMAKRVFKAQLENAIEDEKKGKPKSQLLNTPEDFVFVRVGYIETESGDIEKDYEELLEAYEYVKKETKETDKGGEEK